MTKLETARLIIRDYTWDDLNDLHLLLSDKENMYFLDDISTDTIDQSEKNLRMAMSNADGHYFCITQKETNAFIGSIGYTIEQDATDGKTVHMGYFILPAFQRLGYTTEAVKRVLAFAFDEDGCVRVTTACYRDNEPSRKVMEKAGLRKTAERKMAQLHDGVLKDRLFYAIDKHEYLFMEREPESDEESARDALKGDKTALDSLIRKYVPLVHSVVKGSIAPGSEREDLIQEGLIGLYRAILVYNADKGVRFHVFARLCIERQIHTALKAALRGKHSPLRDYEPIPPETRTDMGTPEEILLVKEELSNLENAMNARLSGLERKALAMRLTGLSNTEIAGRVKCAGKVVDNALWRARKKLGAIGFFNEE